MAADANQKDPERGARLARARVVAGFTQRQAAKEVGTSHTSLSAWENGAPISEPKLDALCSLYKESKAWLRYGKGVSMEFARAITDPAGLISELRATYQAEPFLPSQSLRMRLPPAPYARVFEHLTRMENADCTVEQIEEAERVMIDGAYNKLNKRDPRERSDEEMIIDIDAAWAFIKDVLSRQGVKRL